MDKIEKLDPDKKLTELSYRAIFKDQAKVARFSIQKDFEPFREFVDRAIQSSREKESFQASYHRIDSKNEYSLMNYWYSFSIISVIIDNALTANEEEIKILRKFNHNIKPITLHTLKLNGQRIKPIQNGNNTYFFKTDRKNPDIEINDNPEIKFNLSLHITHEVIYDGVKIRVMNQSLLIDRFTKDNCQDAQFQFINYSIKKKDNNKTNNVIDIQLIENETSEISVFDVFFGEEAFEVYLNGDSNKTFKIADRNKNQGTLSLAIVDESSIPSSGLINLKIDHNSLNSQKRAIDILANRPSVDHKPLLILADGTIVKELPVFDEYQAIRNSEFKILTKKELKGNEIQREFVNKALNTPDLMILEGPPGSGKTTAILEFIYQATKQNKKVLLCASTHVAIDNILEKIVDHPNAKDLLKVINPTRIGKLSNIYVEKVKQFSYENLMSNVDERFHSIIENSFNLVCGTTIGILQYPPIKKILRYNSDPKYSNKNDPKIVEPQFDYLIIDEASKTTFNEFLVPAIFAKRWIIVGDVKQLAPYVEKNDLIPTLLTSEIFYSSDNRKAIHFLMQLKKDPLLLTNYAFIFTNSSLKYIDRFAEKINKEIVVAISSEPLNHFFTITPHDIASKSKKLVSLSSKSLIIIAEPELLKQCELYLNPIYGIIDPSLKGGQSLVSKFPFFGHRYNFNTNKDIYENIVEDSSKKIEDEIIWRLIRKYELVNNEPKASEYYQRYLEDIKEFIPQEKEFEYSQIISIIEEIALPSIIMMLQKGIKGRENYNRKSMLMLGLSEKDKLNRFLTLEYQYRMHPNISRLPREYVYNQKALKDDCRTYPPLNYPGNAEPFEIRDIKCEFINRNRNVPEVDAIVEELSRFINQYVGTPIKIAILSFYNGQVYTIRQRLQTLFQSSNIYNFTKNQIEITLNTVDKFQGQEADIVYLSMVQNYKLGFLDSINRVNVAITRAKDKLIIFGNRDYFINQSKSKLLQNLFK